MKILAVIPARGGSKSVPRKNIAMLGGKPLIFYTIREAKKITQITNLIVSTDDPEIAQICKNFGAEVPEIRPKCLATDDAQTIDVVKHVLSFSEKQCGLVYDSVLLLQPTSPLRKASHIARAIDMFSSTDCDSLVSIVGVGGYHPFRMKRLVDSFLVNYIDQGFEDMRPRQNLPPVFIRNGAIYLVRRDVIMNQNQLVGSKCLGYEMSEHESINIDSEIDLKIAEMLLKQQDSE